MQSTPHTDARHTGTWVSIRRTLRAVVAACLPLSVFSGPALAQSFDEAVRANVALGTRLCLLEMTQRPTDRSVFTQAGFQYRGADRGINSYGIYLGVDHFFDAPAGTAKVQVDALDRPLGLCQVITTHMNQDSFRQLTYAVLQQDFPGIRANSHGSWTVEFGASIPLIVSARQIGTRNRYEPPGTMQLTFSFPG